MNREAEIFLKTRTTTSQVRKPEERTGDQIVYNIDSERESGDEVPSLTKLLNRKKLALDPKAQPTPSPRPQAPPPPAIEVFSGAAAEAEIVQSDLAGEVTQAALERTLLQEPSGDPAAEAAPAPTQEAFEAYELYSQTAHPPAPASAGVRLTARTGRSRTAQPLLIWDREQLQKAEDPLGQALTLLFQKGAESSLFLCLSPPPSGKRVPEFVGTAMSGDKRRRGLWTGLRWDPELFPELWNSFVRNGQLELAPPNSATNEMSYRNLIRAAFGMNQDEYLLLLRAGPTDACRGVVAIVSRKSLVGSIGPAMNLMARKIARSPAKKKSNAA